MKPYTILLLFTLAFQSVAAQQAAIDSVKNELRSAKSDTAQVQLLLQLGRLYAYSHPDSTILLGQQAYALALQLNDLRGEAKSLATIGSAHINMGNGAKALELYQKAKAIFEKLHDTAGISAALSDLGYLYSLQNDWAN